MISTYIVNKLKNLSKELKSDIESFKDTLEKEIKNSFNSTIKIINDMKNDIKNKEVQLHEIIESNSSKTFDELEINSLNKVITIIEKVVVHICVGGDWDRLQKAVKLLEQLTGQKPIIRRAKKTIKAFGISRKQPISTLVTLRGEKALTFLKKALSAVGNKIKSSSFDDRGNFAFGIKEHLMIPGTKYDPEIGVFGMDVIVHLAKPGLRVKLRKYRRSKLGKRAIVNREEAINFVKNVLGVEVV